MTLCCCDNDERNYGIVLIVVETMLAIIKCRVNAIHVDIEVSGETMYEMQDVVAIREHMRFYSRELNSKIYK